MPVLWNFSVKASISAIDGSNHDVVDDARMPSNNVLINIILRIDFLVLAEWSGTRYLATMFGLQIATEANVRVISSSRNTEGEIKVCFAC